MFDSHQVSIHKLETDIPSIFPFLLAAKAIKAAAKLAPGLFCDEAPSIKTAGFAGLFHIAVPSPLFCIPHSVRPSVPIPLGSDQTFLLHLRQYPQALPRHLQDL